MKVRNYLGISYRTQRRITRGMQLLLLAFMAIGFYRGNTGIIVNSVVAFLVTLLPGLLERDYEIAMDPALVLWITTAVFLHAAGTLGPYRDVWWWDHMTHMLSSSVVAGAGFATVRAIDKHYEEIYLPKKAMFVFIFLFVMAFGVAWEVLEFGISGFADILRSKTVLTQYGLEDTMKDLVFDAMGGIAVAIFGEAYLMDIIGLLENHFGAGR